jgi:hypothetical protein
MAAPPHQTLVLNKSTRSHAWMPRKEKELSVNPKSLVPAGSCVKDDDRHALSSFFFLPFRLFLPVGESLLISNLARSWKHHEILRDFVS